MDDWGTARTDSNRCINQEEGGGDIGGHKERANKAHI